MMEPTMHDQQVGDAPPAILEEFYWMMSLALDGLLDDADQVQFEAHQAQYPNLAALWTEWQDVHIRLDELPHAEPAPGFVARLLLKIEFLRRPDDVVQRQQRLLAAGPPLEPRTHGTDAIGVGRVPETQISAFVPNGGYECRDDRRSG